MPDSGNVPSDQPDAHPTDDWDLLERVADGDEVAFAHLVARHQERLQRLCHRLLGEQSAAEDAAQEVFLKLYRKAASFERRGQLFTLLYRVATNYCLNQLRRRRIVQFLPLMLETGSGEEAGFEIDPRDESADPERALEAARRWAVTRRRIDRLPPGQRVVLILVRLEGLSYREAAEALEITVGAVESRLVRAMKTLLAGLEQGDR